ncbi:hypothetical protein IMG5_146650 [Ichthyophthirius multifiliis]|uniref:Sperm-tail PG-rich repeat protein n=1 Tax=Ichthyophthirius multifiliis TaxID=5932 RepID=G0QY23_ICHMU|nr:hypothetical protein IMG5_146650 [Ichthyophthirius multifiliis]EGR29892.1 hypothetical protein IMG5_146650 [Ichthyophthirius multifiliis]|eukprot:XP_004031128.1 hypothetical protein IMG5_146650 [Ichthyophthirius multifiliis]
MAFVYLSSKNLPQFSQIQSNLGPGSYLAHQNYNIKKLYAGFNSTVERQKEFQQIIITPGPGDYNIQKIPQNNEKQLLNKNIKSQNNNKKPTQIFCGNQKRFEDYITKEKQLIPGPGSYDYDEQQFQMKSKKQNIQNSDYIISHLLKLNKYQSVPSIPSKYNQYGYTENEENQMNLNQLPLHSYQGTKQDSVGPGQYEINYSSLIKEKYKGTQWHKYKSRNDNILIKQQENIGPGTYDVTNKQIPIYKLKQSPGFILDQSKEQANQRLKNKLKKENQEEQEDEEYINGATPGPGYYYNSIPKKTIKPEKFQNFGSFTPNRFSIEKQQQILIGPGQYDPKVSGLFANKQYIKDRVIQNLLKGYKGNFGVNEKRFKDQIDEIPGPGTYTNSINEQIQNEQQSAVFKSQNGRSDFVNKEKRPPVGSYQLNYYDIEHKIQNQQIDSEIKTNIPNLGFGIAAERFKDKKIEEVDEQDKILKIAKDNNEKQIPKQKNQISFPKADRFSQKQNINKIPGPGDYNYDSNWNKRSYNVHFALL